MTNFPSIVPPPELVQRWMTEFYDAPMAPVSPGEAAMDLAARAAQWGSDQELEACCVAIKNLKWFVDPSLRIAELRSSRRPKPLNLKQQSLALIDLIQGNEKCWDIRDLDVVRRALEALPDE